MTAGVGGERGEMLLVGEQQLACKGFCVASTKGRTRETGGGNRTAQRPSPVSVGSEHLDVQPQDAPVAARQGCQSAQGRQRRVNRE